MSAAAAAREPVELASPANHLKKAMKSPKCSSRFAVEQRLAASRVAAIGAFESVTLGCFDGERMDDDRNEFHEQVELLSLIGGRRARSRSDKAAGTVVLGRRDSSVVGGHLLRAIVRPTRFDSPSHLKRVRNANPVLAIIEIGRK